MSQDYPAEIERLRVKAQQTGERLSSMSPPEHLRHIYAIARDKQAQLYQACHRNPAIGLSGQHDSGKSLLLSLLLNVPGLLAVANVPATANVTRVRVHPAARCEVTGRAFTLLSPEMVG